MRTKEVIPTSPESEDKTILVRTQASAFRDLDIPEEIAHDQGVSGSFISTVDSTHEFMQTPSNTDSVSTKPEENK